MEQPSSEIISAKGGAQYNDDTTSGAAPTSLPEEVLHRILHIELDKLSGRTTGQLGYTGPTTADTIGGTAELTLQYSII